jgi:hypothetical protein
MWGQNPILAGEVNWVTSLTSIYADSGWVSDQYARGETMVLMDASAGPPQVPDVTALQCVSNGAAPGMVGSSRTGPGITGVSGFASSTPPWGTGQVSAGVYGYVANTQTGVGVVGQVESTSAPNATGVAGLTEAGTGVYGSANTGTGVNGSSAAVAVSGNSPQGVAIWGVSPAGYAIVGTTNRGAVGGGWLGLAGYFVGPVIVDGPFTVTGGKGAAVPHPDGTHRVLYSLESPESWFEDFGEGALANGNAEVRIDPDFAAVVKTDEYYVFLTPYGDCRGLYVSNRSTDGFKVREQQGGTSNVRFSYRIVARRKDIDGERLAEIILPKLPALPPSPTLPKIEPMRGQDAPAATKPKGL